VKPLGASKGVAAAYRADNARSDVSPVAIPASVKKSWTVQICRDALPTAPVTAGGLVFVADRTGAVQAIDSSGKLVWKRFTGGPIYYPPAVAHDRVYVGSADGRVYAYAAVDGRFLWSHRIGPRDYVITVYDKLISAWPVSGGVAVQDGVVYAAAGITHYDGTYVAGLDCKTGKLVASNSTSGTLQQEIGNGVSLQGELSIVDGELRFLAGGVYETARYNLKTLKCLNTPKKQVSSQYRTAFYPYYPAYGKYVSIDYTCRDGCTLVHDASYEGSQFVNLSRQTALPPGAPEPKKEAARWARRGGKLPQALWRDAKDRRYTSCLATDATLLLTGHPGDKFDASFMAAVNTADGKDNWLTPLPALPVKGGVTIDQGGQLFVVLENGTLMSFNAP